MAFSWPTAKDEAVKVKLRRAIIFAKTGNKEFKTKHNDEVIDAAKKIFTKLTVRVTNEIKQKQDLAIKRRMKKLGK